MQELTVNVLCREEDENNVLPLLNLRLPAFNTLKFVRQALHEEKEMCQVITWTRSGSQWHQTEKVTPKHDMIEM
jgi:hypothetical protein